MTVEARLIELQKLQSTGDYVYPGGLFRSQRYHPFLPYKREDDNLFFTASIAHILQGCIQFTNPVEAEIAVGIINKSQETFSLFRNKDGLDTYNFWQTQPSRHFPNGWFMNRFKHFEIPDDVDDTALVYLVEDASKERVERLRDKLKHHSNLAYKKAFNPKKNYQHLKSYSTFFGKNMYIEFDICALSNLMRVILSHFKNELNEYDHATLTFISDAILNDDHISAPFYAAPNYPTTELILYHVSRLIPLLPKEYSEKIEEKIKTEITARLGNASGMNMLILENAALKLNLKIASLASGSEDSLNDNSFFFFHAGMITAFENSVAQKLASNSVFHLRYTSKALNRALQIENMLLKRAVTD